MNDLLFRPEPVEAPQAVVLEWEALADADNAFERFCLAAEDNHMGGNRLRNAKDAADMAGETFDPMTFAGERLDPDLYHRFIDTFIERDEPNILRSAAYGFLMRLQVARLPHSITVSDDQLKNWRQLQIDAVGYGTGVNLAPGPNKGSELNYYRSHDDTYPFGQLHDFDKVVRARSLALVASTREAFEGLPEDCTGFWLTDAGELLAELQQDLPENIVAIQSLHNLRVRKGQLHNVPGARPDSPQQIQKNLGRVLHKYGSLTGYAPLTVPTH